MNPIDEHIFSTMGWDDYEEEDDFKCDDEDYEAVKNGSITILA